MARRGPGRAATTTALPLRLFTATRAASDHLPLDAEALIGAAFAASPDCLALLDPTGRLLQINPAGQAMLPSATCGRSFANALLPEARLEIETGIAQTLSGKPIKIESKAHDNGPWLELTLVALAEPAGRYVLVTARNIDKQRRVQERARLAEEQEALAHLTAGLAHDFNNILTVIIGNAELLSERLGGDDENRALAEISLSAARAGADLTRLLLASARPGGNEFKQFCAADCVRELRGLIERSLGPDIELAIHSDPDPWNISADRAQFANVLLNLSLNARHAMPKGGHLAIDIRNVAEGSAGIDHGDQVVIALRDTGSGIPPAVLARVFEPFFTTKSHGTGLGLPMAQAFARRANGELAIESKPGAGTTVFLRLPRAHMQLDLPYTESGIAGHCAGPDECVLVVERHPAVQTLIADQLRELGYRAIVAPHIGDALAHVERMERIDLLLCEQSQWRENAATVGRSLRSRKPNLAILLLAGDAGTRLPSQPVKAPAPLLAKPFTREELARRVRATIDGKL